MFRSILLFLVLVIPNLAGARPIQACPDFKVSQNEVVVIDLRKPTDPKFCLQEVTDAMFLYEIPTQYDQFRIKFQRRVPRPLEQELVAVVIRVPPNKYGLFLIRYIYTYKGIRI